MEAGLSLPDEVDSQDVQPFGLTTQPSNPLSSEATNPVASILAGLCSGSDSGELGEGQQALSLTPELLAQITAALSSNLVTTNSAATQTDHTQQDLMPDTSVSPQTSGASLHLPVALPQITGDLSHVLQQESTGFCNV